MPWVSNDLATAGDASTSRSSVFSRSTMARGVPAGANTPYHMSTFRSPSFSVPSDGTSGSSGWGVSELMASAFSLPAFTCCKATWMGKNIASICPPSRSVTAGAVPR